MKIKKALFTPGKSAFFFDDQQAIKRGAVRSGFVYRGEPVTPGFMRIREAGESISIMLFLDDGQIAIGDATAVQYSGAGGRDPLFTAGEYIPFLEEKVRPILEGMEIEPFRTMANTFETMQFNEKRLHTAIRYGLSQALLDARAKEQKRMQCEVLIDEYDLPTIIERIPVFGQSGDNRYENVDKMIIKQVDVLPHGLVNSIEKKLGLRGEILKEYIRWIVRRIELLRYDESYHPTLHLDVYGTIGLIFECDFDRISDYLASLEQDAEDFPLYIEGPVDMGEKEAQMEALLEIKNRLYKKGSRVRIVADEWCNTLEDIKDFTDASVCDMIQIKTPDLGGIQNTVESTLYCRENKMKSYVGGSCNETDISARVSVHIAIATRPDRILAKPGMGFDEGFTVVNNEMERAYEILKCRNEGV